MELGLSLGDGPRRPPSAAEQAAPAKGVWCFGLELGVGLVRREEENEGREEKGEARGSAESVVQLNLLPLVPVPRRSSPTQLGFQRAQDTRNSNALMRGFDVNRSPSTEDEMEEAAAAPSSSLNSTVSSFQMDLSAHRGGAGEIGAGGVGHASAVGDAERTSSRASDEEENGLGRKKLRLSKEQSAFLEESFKEHNTLNPKQKLALAKQLNLRPRQVEVWFQNRRARTKLKQTEVDRVYLKRFCATLTEENRRLQKELAELRALKSSGSFYMDLPATTLSMCPSCERVASAAATTTTTSPAAVITDRRPNSFAAHFSKPRVYPIATHPSVPPHQPSAAS